MFMSYSKIKILIEINIPNVDELFDYWKPYGNI